MANMVMIVWESILMLTFSHLEELLGVSNIFGQIFRFYLYLFFVLFVFNVGDLAFLVDLFVVNLLLFIFNLLLVVKYLFQHLCFLRFAQGSVAI